MGSHEQSSSGSGFWLTARARCWAEMTKLWLMVAIVALVLSAVQCAKEDDVGLDTREFKQQEKQMLAHRGSVRSLQVHEVWKVSATQERPREGLPLYHREGLLPMRTEK